MDSRTTWPSLIGALIRGESLSADETSWAMAEIIEVATEPALFRLLDKGGADVMVLDGEAQPAGGMGICRQAKDEIWNCPPVLLIIGRADDGWLATWSRADAVISHPIDPKALAQALAGLMRERAAGSTPATL